MSTLFAVPSQVTCVECAKVDQEWLAVDRRAGLGICVKCVAGEKEAERLKALAARNVVEMSEWRK